MLKKDAYLILKLNIMILKAVTITSFIICCGDGGIEIVTTRPEAMFGDTAIMPSG